MSQRSTSPLKRSTVRRTLQRFWDVTRTQPLIVFLSVFSSAGYIFGSVRPGLTYMCPHGAISLTP